MDVELLQKYDEQMKMGENEDIKKNQDARLKAREFAGISLDLDREKKEKEM